MKILSQLTPAETKLILDEGKARRKDLMKFTFMDLLLKKVIEKKEVYRKAHARDKYRRKYTYIIAGKNFKKYNPETHERVFLAPFLKNDNLKIQFRHFIEMSLEESKGELDYKMSVKLIQRTGQYFKNDFFNSLLRQIKLNDKGKKLKTEIVSYLNAIDEQIHDLLKGDQKEALNLIFNLRGNIFLLNNLDFKLLKTIDKELLNQQKSVYSDAYESDIYWLLYIDFFDDADVFDSYFESFDDTVDSFDSEYDVSGCSSWDSGCSSCSGCGGCGGCGGCS